MTKSDIILTGSDREKAAQLIGLLNDRHLSPEQLDLIIPHTKDFFGNLHEVLNKEIDNDHIQFTNFQSISKQTIDGLFLRFDKEPSEEIRKEILKTISQIYERLADTQKDKQGKNTWFKKVLSILGFLTLGILTILVAGKVGGGNEKKS